ncbi:8630_t:CDS:1, partial [Cetraspora pellucida]
PRKMLDHEGINSYHLLQTSSANIIEVSVDYEESNMNLLYKITNNKLLFEASVNSNKSDIKVLTNSVLENICIK